MKLPDFITNEKELDGLLTRPSDDLKEYFGTLEGDIMILGAGGKIGVTLALLAARTARETGIKKRIFAVDLFRNPAIPGLLGSAGVETITGDLLNKSQVSGLPVVRNVIYLAGKKFGTQDDKELTWAINVLAPDYVADHFRDSRIVVYSTGCVYPFVSLVDGGCTEDIHPDPVGEYAQSCLGRERIFSYYSKTFGTKICQFRLNYAVDLRYGILFDIGIKVYKSRPVELAVSHFNCIWQGDSNRMTLMCLDQCKTPPEILNITGEKIISVKETAEKFAMYFDKKAEFTGERPVSVMYLSDSSKAMELFGRTMVPVDKMIEWQARWIMQGGRSLNKPTHFEVTNGKY